MDTLTKLYLSAPIASVHAADGNLFIELADEREFVVPLHIVQHFATGYAPPDDAQLLILHHPPLIEYAHVSERALTVGLADGRILAAPLAWFPRLLHATPGERKNLDISTDGQAMHWPDLDEDITLDRLLVGGANREKTASISRWLAQRTGQPQNAPQTQPA